MKFFKVSKIAVVLTLLLGFTACHDTSKETSTQDEASVAKEINYEEQANLIIGQSFASLNSNLTYQMKENGIDEAISFCNLNANSLVDSLSEYYHADIKRTSLKLRNQANAPTEDEIENLQFYTLGIEQEVEFGDQMLDTEEMFKYYKPIYVMDGCTKCHGIEGETLNADAYEKIAALYPDDQATGYEAGDFRGMWVVSFKK